MKTAIQKTTNEINPALQTFSIRTYYDGQQKKISDLTALDQKGEISLTKQAELASTDINVIMSQYEKTGMLTHQNRFQGKYDDLPDGASFHEALTQVSEAQSAFADLPAHIRTRFGNDPGAFLDFVSDDKNLPEMAKLGLTAPLNVEATPLEEAIDKAPPASKKVGKPHDKPSSDPKE